MSGRVPPAAFLALVPAEAELSLQGGPGLGWGVGGSWEAHIRLSVRSQASWGLTGVLSCVLCSAFSKYFCI